MRSRLRHHATPGKAVVVLVLAGVVAFFAGGILSLGSAVDDRNDIRADLVNKAVEALPRGTTLLTSGATGGGSGPDSLHGYALGALALPPARVFSSTVLPGGDSGWTEIYSEAPGSKGFLDSGKRMILTVTVKACDGRTGCPTGGSMISVEVGSGGPNS